jgi:hypothetical protein
VLLRKRILKLDNLEDSLSKFNRIYVYQPNNKVDSVEKSMNTRVD